MARLSNETLSKVFSNTAEKLNKRLDSEDSKRRALEETITDQTARIERATESFEETTRHFKPDLSDFNNAMDEFTIQIRKEARNVQNKALTTKIVFIYSLVVVVLGSLLFFSFQHHKELKQAESDRDLLWEFVQDKHLEEFHQWNRAD